MPKRILLPLLALVLGCTHTLTIDNFPDARFLDAFPTRPLVVGLIDQSGGPHSDAYLEAIARGLQMQPGIARVVHPYANGAHVDAIAQVDVNPEYRGSGVNFFVNWPGFLVFAPAWNGYRYQANPKTRVRILSGNGRSVQTLEWEHDYVFHQADMGRTWTQLGWLEYGITPLIGGIVFINYDTDQTPHFIDAVSDNYGRQVAHEITRALSTLELAEEETPPAATAPPEQP